MSICFADPDSTELDVKDSITCPAPALGNQPGSVPSGLEHEPHNLRRALSSPSGEVLVLHDMKWLQVQLSHVF